MLLESQVSVKKTTLLYTKGYEFTNGEKIMDKIEKKWKKN